MKLNGIPVMIFADLPPLHSLWCYLDIVEKMKFWESSELKRISKECHDQHLYNYYRRNQQWDKIKELIMGA